MSQSKLKRRADGRYKRNVKVGTNATTCRPIWVPVYAKTISEVNQAVKEMKEQVIRGEYIMDKDTTVGDYADTWLKASVSPSRVKSYLQYSQIIKNHIKRLLGDVPINGLKSIQVQEAITAIINEGKTKTAVDFRRTMIQIVESACDNGMILRNVAAKTKKPNHHYALKQPLTENEVALLLSADLSDEDRLFLLLCLFQGLRKGEALGLQRVTTDRIQIHQTWVCNNNVPSIKPLPKTKAGIRNFKIVPIVRKAIDKVQEKHNRMYLLSSEDGSIYSEEKYNRMWNRILRAFNEAAGGVNAMGLRKAVKVVPQISSHYLRHTFATMLYYASFDVLQMQYLLGHDDITTTLNTYTHMEKESLGTKNKYTAYVPMFRETFLDEKTLENKKGSKKVQTAKIQKI